MIPAYLTRPAGKAVSVKHPRILSMLLVCALALTACGDDVTSANDGVDDVEVVASDDGDEGADDQQEVGNQPSDPSDSEDEQPSGDNEPLTGEDGWTELHDVPLPEPGRMELTIDGELFATDVECGRDPVRNDETTGSLFLFSLLEGGITDDGREFRILVNRAIAVDSQVDELYETGGSSAQVTLSFPREDGNDASAVVSPKDDDPRGELLPLVHVDPSGGFTMEGTMEAFQGDDAVTGNAVLAGQCQEDWLG